MNGLLSSPTLRAGAAMAAYAAAHSALASAAAKGAAARLLGERARDVAYRPFYLAQSVATTAALVRTVNRLPERTLVVYPRPLALAFRGAHVAATAFGVWALVASGVGRVSGIDAVVGAATGGAVGPTPPAHGPYEGGARAGGLRVAGPFRRTRHPLNVAFLPMLWSAERLTTRRLGAALVGTAYVFLGSALEERRNRAAYGTAYEGYRRRVPFFWPRVRPAR